MIYNEKSITEKRKKLYSSKARVRTAAGAILFYLLFLLVLTTAAGTAGFLYGSFRGVLDDIPEEYSLEPKETIVPISARLISNKVSYKFKHQQITTLCENIQARCRESR